jgi:hypothetical protein
MAARALNPAEGDVRSEQGKAVRCEGIACDARLRARADMAARALNPAEGEVSSRIRGTSALERT